MDYHFMVLSLLSVKIKSRKNRTKPKRYEESSLRTYTQSITIDVSIQRGRFIRHRQVQCRWHGFIRINFWLMANSLLWHPIQFWMENNDLKQANKRLINCCCGNSTVEILVVFSLARPIVCSLHFWPHSRNKYVNFCELTKRKRDRERKRREKKSTNLRKKQNFYFFIIAINFSWFTFDVCRKFECLHTTWNNDFPFLLLLLLLWQRQSQVWNEHSDGKESKAYALTQTRKIKTNFFLVLSISCTSMNIVPKQKQKIAHTVVA